MSVLRRACCTCHRVNRDLRHLRAVACIASCQCLTMHLQSASCLRLLPIPWPVSSPAVGLAAAVAGASDPVLPTVGGGGIDTCTKAGAAHEMLTGTSSTEQISSATGALPAEQPAQAQQLLVVFEQHTVLESSCQQAKASALPA